MGDSTTLKFSGRARAAILLLALCLVFLLSGCTTRTNTTMKLTPVADPPTGVHLPGKFVWNDLLTDDVPRAKYFYGDLFGWEFKQLGRYTVISLKGRTIGGMVQINEAARVDGAGAWRTLRSITIPLLRPVIAVIIIIRGIDAARAFDVILIQTEGGPQSASEVLSLAIYREMIRFGNLGLASAVASLFLIGMLVFAIVVYRLLWAPARTAQ